MLDINLIRNDPEIIESDLKKRGDKEKLVWLKDLIEKDRLYRQLQFDIQKIKAQKNVISKEINDLKKQGKDIGSKLKDLRDIPEKISVFEAEMEEIKKKIDFYLMRLPNILHGSVPKGENEEDNVEEQLFNKKPEFNFTPISHVDIMQKLDLAEFERAAKISGARFWFLKGELAMLDLALQKYAVDFMTQRSYTLIQPPFMMNRASYEGVTDLADFENVMYKIENDDLYLIATSEHPLTAQYMDEVLEEESLPLRLVGISTNFRKEAGSHGKDTKGIFRGHQFNKIEQIIICKPQDSWKFHEELIKNAQDFFDSLGLHFRRVNICTGDIGTVAAKKYDLEVWMPVQQTFREIVSCSNCTDYQARRLNIKYRTKDGNKHVHTLNSTCVATSRALVAILENYQQENGSIRIPKVLVPYMNGIKTIKNMKK